MILNVLSFSRWQMMLRLRNSFYAKNKSRTLLGAGVEAGQI